MSRFTTNLQRRIENFPTLRSAPLTPLFEAVVNSLHAIDERAQENPGWADGRIDVEIVRDGQMTLADSKAQGAVTGFRISDNGIGFTDRNLESFFTLDSDYKEHLGGKGIGRLAWLRVFESAVIESTFQAPDGIMKRSFTFSTVPGDIDVREIPAAEGQAVETVICLNGRRAKYRLPKGAETIAKQLMEHLVSFLLDPHCPWITVHDERDSFGINALFHDIYQGDEDVVRFELEGEEFRMHHFRTRENAHGNRLHLCANNRGVLAIDLSEMNPNVDSGWFSTTGYCYLGVLHGDYLDRNVTVSRDSFDIPADGPSLIPDLTLRQIKEGSLTQIESYLSDDLARVEDNKKMRIRAVMKDNPQLAIVAEVAPETIDTIGASATAEEIANRLDTAKFRHEQSIRQNTRETMRRLEATDDPEAYERMFKECVDGISELQRTSLAQYVAQRKVIIDLLGKALRAQPGGSPSFEKQIHNLFFPMQKTNHDTSEKGHNLWLIDDRLTYCRYIASDKRLDGGKRPDILCLDEAIAWSDGNDGYYDSLVICELKRPGRDDYDGMDNPIDQMLEYVRIIREGRSKDTNARPINLRENAQIYLYAICDITKSLLAVLEQKGNYTRTPDGMGYFSYHSVYKAYIEVLSYDKILSDARKRHHAFFSELGID